jgi:hypothetical protein
MMGTSEPSESTVAVGDWLGRVRAALGPGTELPLSSAEQQLLLDIARISAHACERKVAPLSTYLAGLALASVPPGERVARLEALVRELERGA